jgi:transposase InsO family protein
MLPLVQEIQGRTGASIHTVAGAAGIGYRRLLRWRARLSAGKPVLVAPGPKKTANLPLAELKAEIAALQHGRRRTRGTAKLYARYHGAISRRALAGYVAQERARQNQTRRKVCKQVQWHWPNLAWAVDATELHRDQDGHKLYIHAARDLCSRFGFDPSSATQSNGPTIAGYIETLFQQHGAPLFLKRDNGSPFNDDVVDAVLSRYGVIPLNSPPHYPQYNGAIENGMLQIQTALGDWPASPSVWKPDEIAPYLTAVQRELNCRPRRSLDGRSACEIYYQQRHARYGKSDRLAVFEWIKIHAIDRIKRLEKVDQRSAHAAWRAAAESWLRCQGLITVSVNNKVLPRFSKNRVH